MTKVKVFAGACGFYGVIKARLLEKTRMEVQVISGCSMLQAMNEDLGVIDWTRGVFARICDSIVYQSASRRIRHPDCPVPAAIIKAIQVEIGGAVPKGAYIKFEQAGEEEEEEGE